MEKWILGYFGVMSIVTFFFYGFDKFAALRGARRIPNATLLGLSFLGGSPGALLGIYLFRHKTKKKYYTWTVPLMLVLHLVILYSLMKRAGGL